MRTEFILRTRRLTFFRLHAPVLFDAGSTLPAHRCPIAWAGAQTTICGAYASVTFPFALGLSFQKPVTKPLRRGR